MSLQELIHNHNLSQIYEYTRANHLAPKELALLLRDDSLRYIGLLYLRDSIFKIKQREVLLQYAALLPTELSTVPEEQALLADLYLKLWPWRESRALPRWRDVVSLCTVRIAWCRTEIIVDPAMLGAWGDDEVLRQAVESLRPAEVLYPRELLAGLLKVSYLQGRALSLLPLFVQSCALLPSEASELLCLALQAKTHLSDEVFSLFSMPWARVMSCPTELKRALQESSPSVALVRCASAWRLSAPLFRVLSEEPSSREARQEAMIHLGEHVERTELSSLVERAGEDPVSLGGPLFSALQSLHRRGLFVRSEHLSVLLQLFFVNESISASDFTRITFTCRKEVVALLAALPADDLRWRRASLLLVAFSLGPQGKRLDIPQILLSVLAQSQRKMPILEALASLEDSSIEAAVLPLLDQETSLVIAVLRRNGGEATRSLLSAWLGVSSSAPHPASYAEFSAMLSLLWGLSSYQEKQSLLSRLEPTQLPDVIRRELESMQPPEAKRVLLHQAPGSTRDYLLQIARFGDQEEWETIENLFLRLVTEIAAGEVVNNDERGEEQQTIPSVIIEQLKLYGQRLAARGRIRPAFLLDVRSEVDAGVEAVVTLCIDLLQRNDLSVEETAILLRALRPFSSHKIFSGVYHLLREEEPHLRKLVLFLLAKDGAEILSGNLSRLTEADDIQTVRQALAALGKSRASWASHSIVHCLNHRNMNIKKVAAEALAESLTPEAVPELLLWLSRQDNPGFRDLLISSVSRLLQDYFVPTVLAAAQSLEDVRQQELLLSSMSGRLKVSLVQRAVQREHPVSALLLALLQRGSLAVHPGSLDELWAEFERLGLPFSPKEERREVLRPEILALQENGWDVSAARACLLLQELSPKELSILRRFFAEWLGLVMKVEGEALASLLRLLASFDPLTAQEMNLLSSRVSVLLLGLARCEPPHQGKYLRLIESVSSKLTPVDALWVVSQLRQLYASRGASIMKSQRSYLSLLKMCGAIWTRADVKLALSHCLLGYDHRAETISVLSEAFGAYDKGLVPEELRAYLASCISAGELPERGQCQPLLPKDGASRAMLSGLFEIFADATPSVREILLDWMEELQPIGGPAWVLRERDVIEPRARKQTRHDIEWLLSLLVDKERAQWAAEHLLKWSGESVSERLFDAYLKKQIYLTSLLQPRLLDHLSLLPLSVVHDLCQEKTSAVQIFSLIGRSVELKRSCLPLLLELSSHREQEIASGARGVIRSTSPEVVFSFIEDRVIKGDWQLLSLLSSSVIETPARRALLQKYGSRSDVPAWLRFVPCPLRTRERAQREDAGLLQLQQRRSLPPQRVLTRQELFGIATGADDDAAKKAMTTLAAKPDAEIVRLLLGCITCPTTKIRLHAHRLLRSIDKEAYLEASRQLLDDPLFDVQRSAIRAVTFARDEGSLPKVAALLHHPHQAVRLAVEDGLLYNAEAALPALKKAMKDARPDKREVFQQMIDKVEVRLAREAQ